MSKEVKILKPEFIDWAAEKLDKALFQKGVPEIIDGPAWKGTLALVNNAVSKKVADEFKPDLHSMQDLIIAQDYDDAAAELVDNLILIVNDAPYLTDKVKGMVVAVLGLVRNVLGGLD